MNISTVAEAISAIGAKIFGQKDDGTPGWIDGDTLVQNTRTGKTGYCGIESDGESSITSFIGQASATNGEMRFRLSRANDDPNGARDFLINPYTYGMGIEYPGLIEIWSSGVCFHNNNRGTVQNLGGQIWIDDELDAGGLHIQSWNTHGPLQATAYTSIASEKFNGSSGGQIKFQVRDSTDAFEFQQGARSAEVTKIKMYGTGELLVGAERGESFTGRLTVLPKDSGQLVLNIVADENQSVDMVQISGWIDGLYSRFNKKGYFMTRKVAAPADGDLAASEVALWFDDTDGAARMMFKGKTADGTVRSGSVSLL